MDQDFKSYTWSLGLIHSWANLINDRLKMNANVFTAWLNGQLFQACTCRMGNNQFHLAKTQLEGLTKG